MEAPLMELWRTLPLFSGGWGGGEQLLSLYKIVSLDRRLVLRPFFVGSTLEATLCRRV